jgi:formylglycine-generating enzyme required for sulfatase activity
VALSALSIIFLFSATSASAVTPQGKGGTIKPAPTPTPATTKTTSPKKNTTPAKANRTGASKTPARQAEPEAAKPSAAEIAFWETIKDSKNPQEFKAYLKKYTNGEFADLARSRLNALEAAAKEDAARKEEAKREEAKKEEAKQKEEAEKKRPGAGMKNRTGIEFVLIPPGSFMMGSTNGESEKPVHQVTISNAFYMGKYEVTQAQWQAVMGNNPSYFKDCNQCPVEQVSWNDAQEFIRELNAREDGFTYRLPSEAEWEYACRAGTTTAFAFGDSLSSEQANFDGNQPYGGAPKGVYREKTVPVGTFQPNGWGLFDMHGNVQEWCEDWFHDNYNGAPTDGSVWKSKSYAPYRRVLRGGGWYYGYPTSLLRSASRFPLEPDYGSPSSGSPSSYIGFRLVAIPRTH